MKTIVVSLAVALAISLAAATGSAGVAKAAKITAFKTKSGNIVCTYSPKSGGQKALLECGIRSGLIPKPPKTGTACKHTDYTHNMVYLYPTGKGKPIPCSGDAGPFALAKQATVLQPRQHFGKGGFWCITPHPSRMVCTNGPVHGFSLSKPHSDWF